MNIVSLDSSVVLLSSTGIDRFTSLRLYIHLLAVSRTGFHRPFRYLPSLLDGPNLHTFSDDTPVTMVVIRPQDV